MEKMKIKKYELYEKYKRAGDAKLIGTYYNKQELNERIKRERYRDKWNEFIFFVNEVIEEI